MVHRCVPFEQDVVPAQRKEAIRSPVNRLNSVTMFCIDSELGFLASRDIYEIDLVSKGYLTTATSNHHGLAIWRVSNISVHFAYLVMIASNLVPCSDQSYC